MKIVRFSHNGQSPRLGILEGKDRVVDLEASYAALLASRGVVRARAIAAALFPQSTRGFLEGGQASQDALASMMEAVKGGRFQAVAHSLSSVRLHAPINDPGKSSGHYPEERSDASEQKYRRDGELNGV